MNTTNAQIHRRKNYQTRTPTHKKTIDGDTAIILLALAIAVIFTVIGFCIGSRVNKTTHADKPDIESFQIFGQYDPNIITEEISLDWIAGDLDYKPLTDNLDADLQEFIYYLCDGYNIDFSFVIALIEQESGYNADIISETNDYGLMQINVYNHKWLSETLGIDDFLDPYQNVRAGIFTLRKLFERYQNPAMVLMAYNMGEPGAAKLWERHIYNTVYSDTILSKQAELLRRSKWY